MTESEHETPDKPEEVAEQRTAADVLQEMADTFRERNAVYGDNYNMIAPMMAILFPNGVPSELVTSHQFHLFELILVKLSRFAISGLQHKDSIHDLAVYGAMIESVLDNPRPYLLTNIENEHIQKFVDGAE